MEILSSLFKFCLTLFVCAQATGDTLKVLTYDSLLGKGSLGVHIAELYKKKCPECRVSFESTKDLSTLYKKLLSESVSYDVVLGLDGQEKNWAKKKNLISDETLFEQSPFAIIVDSKKLPQSQWPKSWAQLLNSNTFRSSLFVQDPRLSQAGLGWLRVLFEMNLGLPAQIQKIVAQTFPSWTAAYSKFSEGGSLGVWSYLSSEAYHRCQEKTDSPQFRAIPLKEGYPVQEEWVARVSSSKKVEASKKFIELVLSEDVQREIPLKNWMFPAKKTTPLPTCFGDLGQNWISWKVPSSAESIDETDFQRRLDAWSLL
jgi:thiamine transport system substrate-binding protein